LLVLEASQVLFGFLRVGLLRQDLLVLLRGNEFMNEFLW
jgi:hypothetical protein